ncbi:hypothetical protein TSAR_010717 [Trichomalopsis sarcophagae]|uniref:cholesterol 7-desaturase n=1 Tax=Trichomalopsis sarcophagae TaxID=543379 RepID=A0A232ERP7_9HYME|nr:hypothetical protein TSAR_010717 [Trichomalopsis sarcophagae]
MIVEFCTACALAAFVTLVYLCFFYKINWIRDLTDTDPKSSSLMAKYRTNVNQTLKNLPPVYPNGWFGLLESSSLENGQIEHVAALGQNFAVFRTESGVVRVVDAFCPHLGANMAEGGKVIGEDLECHFHSWRFCGETGKCTTIPYTKTVPSNIKAKVWESIEANGSIFVWHHAENVAPYWWPQKEEAIAKHSLLYQGRNEYYVNCHIQDIPENGADWAHLGAIHGPAMLPTDMFTKIMHHRWTNISWSTTSQNEATADDSEEQNKEKHIAYLTLHHDLILFDKFSILTLKVKGRQVGPGCVEINLESALGPMFIVQTVTPVQPLVHRVTHTMYASRFASFYSKIVFIGECIMFERDVRVWNHKKFMHNPALVKEDRTIKAFRKWYQQFYSENSPTYESCKASLDW